jgi:WD40 repeat protein
MPEPAPPGISPLFLRGVTAEKYGFKTGEGVMDLVDHMLLKKEDVVKEIATLGVMSDFEPARKNIESYPGDELLFVVDKTQKYGEIFLLCYTEEARSDFMRSIQEAQDAIEAQRRAEEEAEAARVAAEYARQNIKYEDKPLTPRVWVNATSADTEAEVHLMSHKSTREPIAYEVIRPKRHTKQSFRFLDRNPEAFDFRAMKDPNFKRIKESDMGIQVAPPAVDSAAQTTWYRPLNKSIQYEAPPPHPEPEEGQKMDELLDFLERVTLKVESALQQNEAVDIFHETFRMVGDDDVQEGARTEDELREIKNFADPTYSKSKSLVAVDWLPKHAGMVAVSAVKNISFDQRVANSGQTSMAYVLLWDFRYLVKPQLLMQCNFEVFTFRFNRVRPGLVAGGTYTGQVVLWDVTDILAKMTRHKGNQRSEDDEGKAAVVAPKYMSHVDHSHKRCVADLVWLPPTTQVNYRGQLVGQEHLDGNSYQFVTVAGDGMVMVWDIRYEEIAQDELKHIGRAKHFMLEKAASKDAPQKPVWAPIYKAPLKRLEGVGELSLCKVNVSGNLKPAVASGTTLPGDIRSHLMISTEEGDVIFSDICAKKEAAAARGGDDEDDKEEGEGGRNFVKWMARDHPRPCVSLQQSPFFPDILLSVGDFNFHIWKVGEDKPLFVSPVSTEYLTCGAWSPTRPAVLFVAGASGHLMAWDFTDSSFRPSATLKATHQKLTSMEFFHSAQSTKQQLLAAGDEQGTLHVFEMPRNLIRPVHKESAVMQTFLDREFELSSYVKATADDGGFSQPPLDAFAGGPAGGAGEPAVEAKEEVNAAEEARQQQRELAKREDEDFDKLETAFMEMLGLGKDK